jgi:hypothetical protein
MRNAVIAITVTLLSAGAALAQTAGYDKANETTITGTIRYVLSGANQDGTVGVHLEVTTPTGPVRVALGPAMYIASNNFYFFVEEPVYVVGARVGKSGELRARSVSKDGKTFLILRNEDGTPKWSQSGEEDGCGVSHAPIR